MHGILVFVSICAVWNRVDPEAKPIVYKAFGTLDGLFDGATLMMYDCSGIIYLPFVFSDMYEPASAGVVVRKAYRHSGYFWFAMALVGYIGWGDSAGMGFFDISYTVLDYFPVTGRILRAMIGVQAFLSYPLRFAPLFRTAKCLLALDMAPAVSLHLPWAIRQLWWEKKGLQVGLVFAGMVSNVVNPMYVWEEGLAWIPTNFCCTMLPAGFSFAFEARRRMPMSTSEPPSEASTPASAKRALTRARDSITLNDGLRNGGGCDGSENEEGGTKAERNAIVPLTSLVFGIVILFAGLVRFRSPCESCLRNHWRTE
jgi:hypothetical protein